MVISRNWWGVFYEMFRTTVFKDLYLYHRASFSLDFHVKNSSHLVHFESSRDKKIHRECSIQQWCYYHSISEFSPSLSLHINIIWCLVSNWSNQELMYKSSINIRQFVKLLYRVSVNCFLLKIEQQKKKCCSDVILA